MQVELVNAVSQVFKRNFDASSLISRDTLSVTLNVSEKRRNFRRLDLIYLAAVKPFALGISLKKLEA